MTDLAITIPTVFFGDITSDGDSITNFPENAKKVCKFDAGSNIDVLWSVAPAAQELFIIDQNGELSFKEAPNFEQGNIKFNVKVTATAGDQTTDKTIEITIKDNQEESRLTKFLNSGFTFTFGALLLFLLEIYPLVLFIKNRKNLNNLSTKEKISLAKIIINLLGLLMSTLALISTILYISINDLNEDSTLNGVLGVTRFLGIGFAGFILLLVSPIIGIIYLIENRNEGRTARYIISYIQTIAYPILAIVLGVAAVFIATSIPNATEPGSKSSKDRRSKLKKLLGSKK